MPYRQLELFEVGDRDLFGNRIYHSGQVKENPREHNPYQLSLRDEYLRVEGLFKELL